MALLYLESSFSSYRNNARRVVRELRFAHSEPDVCGGVRACAALPGPFRRTLHETIPQGMIELKNVSVRTRGTMNPVPLTDINLRVEAGQRVAILSPKSGGVSLILDVICGANAPFSGSVTRTGRISWPIPSGAFFHRHQTYVANARFFARLYEVDQNSYISEVLELADVGDL